MNITPSLTLHPNVLQAAGSNLLFRDLTSIPSVATTWQRSIRRDGGYWLGSFRVEGLPREQLRQMYGNWLAKHLVEKTSGITWEGMVYEMTLHDGISRRISLEPMANRVQAVCRELLTNGGFEIAGEGDTFEGWSEDVDANHILSEETTTTRSGSTAAKLERESGALGGEDIYISQQIAVEEKRNYRLSLFCYNDPNNARGRYQVLDVTSGTNNITAELLTPVSNDWETVSVSFVTPTGCDTIEVRLYGPNLAGPAYTIYDDVKLSLAEGFGGSSQIARVGAVVDNAASQAVYGIKEAVVEANSFANAEQMATQYLALNAWPKTERGPATNDEVALDVVVAGYIFTTKWALTTWTDWGTPYPSDELVEALLDDCPYIANRVIRTPDGYASLPQQTKPITARDAINAAMETGNGESQTWRLYMTANRTAVFETIPADPLYAISNGVFVHSRANRTPVTNPYIITPGVIRDLDSPQRLGDSGGFFVDPRDFMLDEITVGPNGVRWSEGAI